MADATDAVLLYSTWPDRPSAEAAARELVEARLVACANIVSGAVSVFSWEGQVQAETEVIMLAKTCTQSAKQARDTLLRLHPYDLPCVTAWPIGGPGANPAFLAWIGSETAHPG